MTLKERVVVEVYTGICMVTGNDRDEVYKYMAEIMGRPVYSHELADKKIMKELREKSRDDFVKLCQAGNTNADRIRSMTDEELAKFIEAVGCNSQFGADCGYPFCDSMKGKLCNGIAKETDEETLKWLQSQVEPCILAGIEPTEDKRPCIGYGKSDIDDEPCEMCKQCKNCTLYFEED